MDNLKKIEKTAELFLISLRGTAYQSISKALFQNQIRKTELKNLVTLSYYHNQKCFNHAVIVRELDGFGTREKNWITKSLEHCLFNKKIDLMTKFVEFAKICIFTLITAKS